MKVEFKGGLGGGYIKPNYLRNFFPYFGDELKHFGSHKTLAYPIKNNQSMIVEWPI